MAEQRGDGVNYDSVFERFPANGEDTNADRNNPAIRIYGRRFHNSQTPVEYLSEFLLVFASAKQDDGDGVYKFSLTKDGRPPYYYPEDRIALKLFSFLPSSKLETRHLVHRQAYIDALRLIGDRINGTREDKEETIRLIQSLFVGFVGVAKNRTWVTHSFLPVSYSLLARELDWLHSKAKVKKMDVWDDAKPYFAHDRHNFMARGGELLFLQLTNLFSTLDSSAIASVLQRPEYRHLNGHITDLCENITSKITALLVDSVGPLSDLAKFVEDSLEAYKLNADGKNKGAPLGWVPAISRVEAMLFAVEINNICSSNLSSLDKLDFMQTLCCIQVVRSLCFQGRRVDQNEDETEGFCGNYVWIVADPEAKVGSRIRQMAQISFDRIDGLLYRVLRNKLISGSGSMSEADKNGFQIFRKITKEIGLVMPRTGKGQRFTLDHGLLRFLVAALLSPGERVRLNNFYRRVFAHYGIALGEEQLSVALRWSGNEANRGNYAISSSTDWVAEALKQGGFLVELSDAVSMVQNPGKSGGSHNEFIY